MDDPKLVKRNLLGYKKPHISREGGLWKVWDGIYWAVGFTITSAWDGVRETGCSRWRGGRPPVPPCAPSCRHL